jgi:transposase
MKSAIHVLGIDIAKAKFDVHLRTLLEAQPAHSGTFNNEAKGFQELQRWLTQHGVGQPASLHACLESTSRYGDALAGWLHTQGYQVSLVNPCRTRHYANSRQVRTVNDRIDAALIADFCAEQRSKLLLWEPLPAEHRQLQDLTRARQALVEHRDGFVNLLETATGLARKSFQRQRTNLEKEIQRLDEAIKEFLAQPASAPLRSQVSLADSIPGVGLITAATVVAELPPLGRLLRANQAIALFGLDPRSKTSGATVKTPARLSKMGSRRGRRALYMPGLTALRCNPIVQALGQRLRERGHRGKYIVVAAMRKLLRLIVGVIKSGQPFDPQWTQRQAKGSPALGAALTA